MREMSFSVCETSDSMNGKLLWVSYVQFTLAPQLQTQGNRRVNLRNANANSTK